VCHYIQGMRRLIIVLAVGAVLGLILLAAGTARNQGCLPWKEPIRIGGSTFSEGGGETICR